MSDLPKILAPAAPPAPRLRWNPIRDWLDRKAIAETERQIDAATLQAFDLPPIDRFALARVLLVNLLARGEMPPAMFDVLSNELGQMAHRAGRVNKHGQ